MKIPHSLVLLYGMVLFAYVLTWLLPSGEFQTQVSASGATVVIPGTFALLENDISLPIWSVFTVIPRGLGAAQGVIFFILIIGGALAIVRSTGAIDAGIGRLLVRFKNYPALLVFLIMLVFAVGASTFGMAEEKIPLTAIMVALCLGFRMDALTAAGIMIVGEAIGYAAASINPFSIVIAQDIAQLPLLSGLTFRLIMFVPLFAIGFFHVWRYAKHVRNNPSRSLVADIPNVHSVADVHPQLTARHKLVLAMSFAALSLLVWGIVERGWYLTELGALFVALAMLSGLVMGQSVNEMAKTFSFGAAELTSTALVCGFARSIELMLSDAQVLHTIVNGLAAPLTHLGAELSAVGMLFIQAGVNFFIPSGSGQAYVTMPLMAPISDILGVSRQVAILAFQLGDGFTNLINPTSAVLLATLGIAGVPFGRWLRFVWPLVVQYFVVGSLTLIIAVLIGYE